MKFLELMTTLRVKVIADKRIFSGVVAVVIAIVSVGGYLGYQELVKR